MSQRASLEGLPRNVRKLRIDLERHYAEIGKSVPLADVIALLASPAASYVTGTSINVDGGYASAV